MSQQLAYTLSIEGRNTYKINIGDYIANPIKYSTSDNTCENSGYFTTRNILQSQVDKFEENSPKRYHGFKHCKCIYSGICECNNSVKYINELEKIVS